MTVTEAVAGLKTGRVGIVHITHDAVSLVVDAQRIEVSGLEMLMNGTDEQLADLVRARVEAARRG